MKTLVIIDVQNDFLAGGALEVPEGNQIIPVINKIQKEFDLVVATQDWHPPGHKSFASNHSGQNAFDEIDLNGLRQTLWPDHCVQNSNGAEFPVELNTARVEAIFRKGMSSEIDSYSAFFDNGHRKTTGLAGYLREKSAKKIYFCGLAADICVYYTVQDANRSGFETVYVEDGCRPLDSKKYEKVKIQLIKEGTFFLKSDEL